MICYSPIGKSAIHQLFFFFLDDLKETTARGSNGLGRGGEFLGSFIDTIHGALKFTCVEQWENSSYLSRVAVWGLVTTFKCP